MRFPIVSIIMPVYNSAGSLDRAICSIICQTEKAWELIIINDGSTDNSLEILKKYSIQDSRIQIYSKQNGGVASARQLGLDCAKGKYVIHADSDDYVESDWLANMVHVAERDNADVVICYYMTDRENQKYYHVQEISVQ